MVDGLDRFAEHFAAFQDRYVIIGGTACDAVMNRAGVGFRATKDIDMVLCVETLDAAYLQAFWAFIKDGQYSKWSAADLVPRFYRFVEPKTAGYPSMLELFARLPDSLGAGASKQHITRVPVDDEASSLSAILLDEDYYTWTFAGKEVVSGLSVVRAEHLIPLKVRAWLDLTRRREEGETVRGSDIRKHRNDVFKLYSIADPDYQAVVPNSISEDILRFVELVRREDLDLRALGLAGMDLDEILRALFDTYGK